MIQQFAIPTQYIDPKAECHPFTKATTMKKWLAFGLFLPTVE